MDDTSRHTLSAYMRILLVDFESLIRNAGTDFELLAAQMNAQTGRASQLFMGGYI